MAGESPFPTNAELPRLWALILSHARGEKMLDPSCRDLPRETKEAGSSQRSKIELV